MKSVVLINPYQKDGIVDAIKAGVQIDNRKRPPVDLAYCSALLKKNGFKTRVLDANISRMSASSVMDFVEMHEPSFVILATSPLDRWECPYLNIDSTAQLMQKIKQKDASVFTACIGPHGTYSPQWVFEKCPELDAVVQGEPEETVLSLASRVRDGKTTQNVSGVAFRDEGGSVVTAPPRPWNAKLDELPFPDYSDFKLNLYKSSMVHNATPFTLVVSSRGCHYGCIFCLRSMWGEKYRARSVDNVMDELKWLKKEYGVRAVYFQDLEFALDYDRAFALCEAMTREAIGLSWACSTRLDSVDEALLLLMKRAGCESVNFGMESGSQQVLNKARKGLKLQNAKQTLDICRRVGLTANLFMMIGLPGESEASLNETSKFFAEQNVFLHTGNLPIPYPGTKLYDMARQELGREPSWDEVGMLAGKIGTELLKKHAEQDVINALRFSYFKNAYGRFYLFRPTFWKNIYAKRRRIKHWLKNNLSPFKKLQPQTNADEHR